MKNEDKIEYKMSKNYEGIDKYTNNSAALYTSPIMPFIRQPVWQPIMPLEKPIPPLIREIAPIHVYIPKTDFSWMEEKRKNDWMYNIGL